MTILIYEDQNGYIRVSSSTLPRFTRNDILYASKSIDEEDDPNLLSTWKILCRKMTLLQDRTAFSGRIHPQTNYTRLQPQLHYVDKLNLMVITRVRNYLLRFSFTILLIS